MVPREETLGEITEGRMVVPREETLGEITEGRMVVPREETLGEITEGVGWCYSGTISVHQFNRDGFTVMNPSVLRTL